MDVWMDISFLHRKGRCKLVNVLKYSFYHGCAKWLDKYAFALKCLLTLHIWACESTVMTAWSRICDSFCHCSCITWTMMDGAHKQNVFPMQHHYNTDYAILTKCLFTLLRIRQACSVWLWNTGLYISCLKIITYDRFTWIFSMIFSRILRSLDQLKTAARVLNMHG